MIVRLTSSSTSAWPATGSSHEDETAEIEVEIVFLIVARLAVERIVVELVIDREGDLAGRVQFHRVNDAIVVLIEGAVAVIDIARRASRCPHRRGRG